MSPIYIIGFMGAGKTAVGEALANYYNDMLLQDTDKVIQEQQGMTVKEIFAQKGEKYFRQLETEVLLSTRRARGIITTGGGIVTSEVNRTFLKENGTVVFLKCEPSVVWERLKEDNTRPLLTDKKLEDVEALYNSRLAFYEGCADIVIDTAPYTVKEVVLEIDKRLKEKGYEHTVV